MKQSRKRSHRERRLERALLVIEGLAMNEEGGLYEQIYRVAHAATGRCGNTHKEWRKQTKEIELKLRLGNVLDTSKVPADSPDLRHGSPYLELCSRLPAKRGSEATETAGSPLG